MATAVVVGTVIGSGVFKKPQVVAENVPFSGLAGLVWVLGGVLALLGALAVAEVATLFPRAGGNYVYLREGFGRLSGFLWGWVELWIVKAASIAALATVFADSLQEVLANPLVREWIGSAAGTALDAFWARRWLTVAVVLVLAVINVLGVRWGGLLQLIITLVKVVSLLGFAALPFVILWMGAPSVPGQEPRFDNLTPVWPAASEQFRLGGLATALLGVLWAYHGWMNIGPVAEEIRQPQRNIPLALLGGVGMIIALYLGANLAYYLVIPQPDMANLRDTTVATAFSERLLGPIGAAVASAAVMASVFGALNGNLLVGPRVLYALGDDGLAPKAFGCVSRQFHTPARAILALALWTCVLIVAAAALTRFGLPVVQVGSWRLDLNLPKGKPLFDVMTDFAMFGAVVFETLAVATVFALRRKLPDADRPYRCWGYPIVPALYVLIMGAVLVSMFVNQRTEALIGVGFIALGGAVYYWITRSARAGKN
jgi:amino acid transporter